MRDGYFVHRLADDPESEAAFDAQVELASKRCGEVEAATPFDRAAASLAQGAQLNQSLGFPEVGVLDPTKVVRIPWSRVAKACELEQGAYNKIVRGLLGSISAIKKCDEVEIIANRVVRFCAANGCFPPTEGELNEAMYPLVNDLTSLAGAEFWWAQAQFDHDATERFDPRDLNCLAPYGGSLVIENPGLIVTTDWDSFFTLVGGPSSIIEPWVKRNQIDGFFADNDTCHYWWTRELQQTQ